MPVPDDTDPLLATTSPNYDAVVETIETCIDNEHPRHYEPVTVSEYYEMKVGKHLTAAR